jgi:nucleotide-binding universal stress UspA family protein
MDVPKVEIKRILYATDLSTHALRAFAYAVSLANLYGAKLSILHVLAEKPSLDARVLDYIDSNKWEEIKRRNFDDARHALIGKRRDDVAMREVLHYFSETAGKADDAPSFDADEILVERGNPVEQILDQAKKRNCDLIVMGSHGHGTFAEAIMGSTARRVLQRAEVPVLMVRLPKDS